MLEKVILNETTLNEIADAIRFKLDLPDLRMYPSEMPDHIMEIIGSVIPDDWIRSTSVLDTLNLNSYSDQFFWNHRRYISDDPIYEEHIVPYLSNFIGHTQINTISYDNAPIDIGSEAQLQFDIKPGYYTFGFDGWVEAEGYPGVLEMSQTPVFVTKKGQNIAEKRSIYEYPAVTTINSGEQLIIPFEYPSGYDHVLGVTIKQLNNIGPKNSNTERKRWTIKLDYNHSDIQKEIYLRIINLSDLNLKIQGRQEIWVIASKSA